MSLARQLADRRVHDGVEPRPCVLVVEDEVGELLPVERAVAAQHVGTELLDDGRERRRARLDDPSGEVVGVDVHRAVLDEAPGDRGLT